MNGKYNFDLDIARDHSDSAKWDQEIIDIMGGNPAAEPFWVADMDFSPPPQVTEALFDRISHPVFGYPKVSGDMIPAFKEWAAKRHNWIIPDNSIHFVPGLLCGVAAAIHVLTHPGDGIIVQTPVYRPFVQLVEGSGRTLVRNKLIPFDSGYRLNLQELEKQASDPQNTMLLFCSPHNPAGRVWNADELNRIRQICEKHNLTVVSDEIHADLTYPQYTHIPFSTLDCRAKTITLMAPSKTFNIAGEKVAFAIIDDKQTSDDFTGFLSSMALSHPSILAPIAAAAAYRYGEEWLDDLVSYLQDNLSMMSEIVERDIPELKLIQPEASFIAFMDCTDLLPLLDGTTPARFFSKQADVLLHDGSWFGPEGKNYVRINFGTQRRRLQDALARMAKAVDQLRT